jgi:hypothetical protein
MCIKPFKSGHVSRGDTHEYKTFQCICISFRNTDVHKTFQVQDVCQKGTQICKKPFNQEKVKNYVITSY